jgi:hypothetical protein
VLALFVLNLDDLARWNMRDANRTFRLIDLLAARPAGMTATVAALV